jgi:DNA-binding response OmpR family regulator
VIEDDADIRECVRCVLGDAGYEVVAAANGFEALGWLRSGEPTPGLILLDLGMPVMNGWQFRDQQRQERDYAAIPVVVLTAVGDAEEKVRGIDPADVICKPFRLETLLAVVQRHCRQVDA